MSVGVATRMGGKGLALVGSLAFGACVRPLTSGSSLGGYEILDLLGAGGMGGVCRARDSRLGRAVAVKVLPDALHPWSGRA